MVNQQTNYEATQEEIEQILNNVRRYNSYLKQHFIMPDSLAVIAKANTVLSARQKEMLPAIAEQYLKNLNNP